MEIDAVGGNYGMEAVSIVMGLIRVVGNHAIKKMS